MAHGALLIKRQHSSGWWTGIWTLFLQHSVPLNHSIPLHLNKCIGLKPWRRRATMRVCVCFTVDCSRKNVVFKIIILINSRWVRWSVIKEENVTLPAGIKQTTVKMRPRTGSFQQKNSLDQPPIANFITINRKDKSAPKHTQYWPVTYLMGVSFSHFHWQELVGCFRNNMSLVVWHPHLLSTHVKFLQVMPQGCFHPVWLPTAKKSREYEGL